MGIYQITEGVQNSSTPSGGVIVLLSPLYFCLCFPFSFCAGQQYFSIVFRDETGFACSDMKD
jgi:hypothetical protein